MLVGMSVIGMRFHALFTLFFPAVLLLVLGQYFPQTRYAQQLKTLKGTLIWLGLPLCLLGLAAYFLVFKDHVDPRQLQDFTDIDRLFLPLFSPAPPLDRYNLLSWNHAFDFLNICLFWSPVLLFVLTWVVGFERKRVDWNRLEIRGVLLAIGLLLGMMWMINPLFSMPMDWDLFCFPMVFLLVFLLVIIRQIEPHAPAKHIMGPCLGLLMVYLPTFWVFTSHTAQPARLTAVGTHIYHT